MSATKRGVSKSQGKSVPGTDRVRMVETSAATIRFTGGGASYSSESDCSDDLVINRECDTRRNTAQPGVHRLANNRVNDDTPTKGRLPIKRGGSHARVKFKNDEGTNPFGSCSDEEENKGSIARVKHKNSDRTNPFGSCSDEEEDKGSIACVKHKNSDRTNPFGSCSDEEEVKGSIARVKHKNSDRTNPFGSCSDDEEHEGSSACVKHKHSGGTNPFGSYSDKEEHKGFVAHMKHKDGDRTNPFGSESGEEAPLEANSVASSHPHISLLSDNDGWTETGRIDKGNAALPGNDSHADHVNRLSLRFNPFNTLCQEDDGDEEDLSHRHRVKSRGDQGLSQMDRTDHKTEVCQPVPTAGQPIMVTPRVKHPSTNCTTSSDSWTDPFELTPQNSGVDNANSNTELDLMEEHFSQPEDHCRMSNRKELETAIKNCKQLIVEVEPNSEDAKNLIHKLVQLRLKLADSMEEKKADDKHVKIVVGHHFEEKQSRSSKHYCEKCNCVIWGMLQRWYRCTACGFCTHAKCLSLITRKCAAVKVSENPTYVMSVCCERGLSSQNYRCSECRAKIGFQRGFPEARQCDYSGDYYCDMCHWNDTGVIPARILHNWDFEPRKVCRASKQFLRLMFSRPVLHIQQINPMLFSYVEELNDTKRLREEIIIMKRYFLSCKAALDSKLLLQLRPRQHFVETSDMYSLKDLVDVATDVLLPELAKIHASIAQHIKTDCQVCQLKGYICELCDLREVLFPFDSIAIVCPQCSAVLHRHCYMQSGRRCPNCERLSRAMS